MPISTTVVINTTGNLANQPIQVSLPAVAGQTNYLCGFSITGLGTTAAMVQPVAITGIVGFPVPPITNPVTPPTPQFVISAPAGTAAIAISPLVVTFQPPIPALGPNIAITLNVPGFGAGNTNTIGTIWGYSQ
jgi:hypothetical protein